MSGSDPALERARLRALSGAVPPSAAPAPTVAKERNTGIIQQPDGTRVPEAFYDLPPEQQRVTLAIGEVPALHTRELRDMEGAIEAAWWRAGDRDEFDLRVQEMSTVLRGGAVALLTRVRGALVQRLAAAGQAPLELLRWSQELLEQRSEEPVGQGPITDLAKAVLEAYGARLRDGDGLVFGQITPADAQLWMECSAAVAEKGLQGSRDVMYRRVQRMFNKVRQAGCSSFNTNGVTYLAIGTRRMESRSLKNRNCMIRISKKFTLQVGIRVV